MSPYDDGWLLDMLAIEIRANDPRVLAEVELVDDLADTNKVVRWDESEITAETSPFRKDDLEGGELLAAVASSSTANASRGLAGFEYA